MILLQTVDLTLIPELIALFFLFGSVFIFSLLQMTSILFRWPFRIMPEMGRVEGIPDMRM